MTIADARLCANGRSAWSIPARQSAAGYLQRYSRTAATSRSMARFAFRISKPKGRIAFTDWVAHRPPSGSDKQLMAVADLYSLQAYAETRAQAAAAAIGTTPK